MLYSGNTFSFPDPASMLFFSQTVLPQRLQLIRSIHILWSYDPRKSINDADKKDVLKLNGVLRKMKKLRIICFTTLCPWPVNLVESLIQGFISDDTEWSYADEWSYAE